MDCGEDRVMDRVLVRRAKEYWLGATMYGGHRRG
jgi:hypothetical protein